MTTEEKIHNLAEHFAYLLPEYSQDITDGLNGNIWAIERNIYKTLEHIHDKDPIMGDAVTDNLRWYLLNCGQNNLHLSFN